MKKIVYLLILFSINVFSQNKNENDYKKLIDSALVIKASDFSKFYHQQLKKDEKSDNWNKYLTNLKNTINNIYVIDENSSSVKLQNVKISIPLKTIDIDHHKNRRLLKKGINVWKVIPILHGNQLEIVIIEFKVIYKNKGYEFANGGGSTIVFQYSCEKEKWNLIKEEHKGI